MGNGAGRITGCFAEGGDISGRHDIAVVISDPTDEGLGYTYFYIRPEEEDEDKDDNDSGERSGNINEENDNVKAAKTTTFRAISGASVSANNSTPLSTSLAADVSSPYSTGLDRAATFESSTLFSSIPLQRGFNGVPGSGSGPGERGFVSGPIERAPVSDSGPTESESSFEYSEPKAKTKKKKRKKKGKQSLIEIFKSIVLDSMNYRGKKSVVAPFKSINSVKETDSETTTAVALSGTTTLNSLNDETEELQRQNLQWAEGKAGEDRVHVVVSEEHGRVFVGIYDGFNGPDAPDYLLTNLYSAVDKELKGLFGSEKVDTTDEKADDGADAPEKHVAEWRAAPAEGVEHGDVLGALSRALHRTEDAFLETAAENPELALMGSCVLVMLMKGEDVYLMNVGDSRAVLARKCPGLVPIGEETAPVLELSNGDDEESGCELSSLTSLQLTMDHSTYMEEEVQRIKSEHPNDPSAVLNERVKGYLKVTRAFGAGFLKQPKWNEALLEMFRIEYVGTCPYLTCAPSLGHHRLSSKDRFLILSSDGLYQYFTNEQAVSEVELFIESFPEGDPAQHLIEQVLFRAARKAGMDFNELLDIPQGERRRYHDDISIIIISLEGRIWRSSV